MDWLAVAVQWAHVLLGVLWFGNALALIAIIIPAINRLPIVTQREISSHIGSRATPIFHVVVPLIVLLGIVRGTVLGPIHSLDAVFQTPYGVTWLFALAATILTYAFGLMVLVPALRRMDAAPVAEDGAPTVALAAATVRVKKLVGLELFGFIIIFTCMILMRFGL